MKLPVTTLAILVNNSVLFPWLRLASLAKTSFPGSCNSLSVRLANDSLILNHSLLGVTVTLGRFIILTLNKVYMNGIVIKTSKVK